MPENPREFRGGIVESELFISQLAGNSHPAKPARAVIQVFQTLQTGSEAQVDSGPGGLACEWLAVTTAFACVRVVPDHRRWFVL